MSREVEMIKGEDPWGPNKKETLYEKLQYFCSKHHWDASKLIEVSEDGFCKPTVKLFLYNCWRDLWCWTPIYHTRMRLQRLFRSDHLSDNQIWEAGFYMSKYCLKMLYAFKKYDRHGYPSTFSEYNENEWNSKEDYNDAIKRGDLLGGGPSEWEKVLDHIIMALEFKAFEGNEKKMHDWWIKYFGMDPWDETNECNKYVKYDFCYKDDPSSLGSHMSFGKPPEDIDRCEYLKKETCYGNTELMLYANKIVQLGFIQMGTFWESLWD
jgi:hypothetical protein